MTSGTSGVYVAPQPCFGSIGDFVWNDYNANGIQDAGEPGISGATVTLNYPGGATSITTTGSTGAYLFSNPAAGTYSIAFSTPAGYSASPSNQGTDDTKDSDPISGSVSGIILTAGQNNTTIDAGFYLTTCIGQAPTFGLLGLSNGNFTIK